MPPDEATPIEADATIRYNDRLASDILASLKVLFPRPTSSSHLKSHNPKFTEATDEEWLLTLDGLYKKGFVSGRPIRTGFASKLREIINLEITNQGLIALQQTLQTPRSYYWALSEEFGRASWKRWATRIAATAIAAFVSYFVQHDPQPLSKETVLGTLSGAVIFLSFDLLSSSWRLHKNVNKQEPLTRNYGAGVVGILLFVLLIAGGVTSVYFNLTPKKHRYAIDPNDPQYYNVSNTLGAFQTLASTSPACLVRVTVPFENRGIGDALSRLGAVYCKLDNAPPNLAEPQQDVVKGAVDNGVVIHMAKEPQARDGFVIDLKNIFAVKRTYDLPLGSPPDLIWIQIGRGYPFRKDDGRSGIE